MDKSSSEKETKIVFDLSEAVANGYVAVDSFGSMLDMSEKDDRLFLAHTILEESISIKPRESVIEYTEKDILNLVKSSMYLSLFDAEEEDLSAVSAIMDASIDAKKDSIISFVNRAIERVQALEKEFLIFVEEKQENDCCKKSDASCILEKREFSVSMNANRFPCMRSYLSYRSEYMKKYAQYRVVFTTNGLFKELAGIEEQIKKMDDLFTVDDLYEKIAEDNILIDHGMELFCQYQKAYTIEKIGKFVEKNKQLDEKTLQELYQIVPEKDLRILLSIYRHREQIKAERDLFYEMMKDLDNKMINELPIPIQSTTGQISIEEVFGAYWKARADVCLEQAQKNYLARQLTRHVYNLEKNIKKNCAVSKKVSYGLAIAGAVLLIGVSCCKILIARNLA